MTAVDPRDPNRELAINLTPVERTAGLLGEQAEAIAERTRLLVLNESLGNSFGSRDVDAAGSYRNTAEVFGDVAKLLRDELNRGKRILTTVTGDYRATDADNAAAIARAADTAEGGPR